MKFQSCAVKVEPQQILHHLAPRYEALAIDEGANFVSIEGGARTRAWQGALVGQLWSLAAFAWETEPPQKLRAIPSKLRRNWDVPSDLHLRNNRSPDHTRPLDLKIIGSRISLLRNLNY